MSQLDNIETQTTEIHKDRGLKGSAPKSIVENTAGESVDEKFDAVTKEIRKPSDGETTYTRS